MSLSLSLSLSLCASRTSVPMDDFNLLEGLTTGHFDAKNKLVRVIFVLFDYFLLCKL